ncbi:Uncharacterised protein [Mycobacteroides abscessus subsp. abscessus]|nr:Uncharacterised protein [Mycobacteroides abscessus subsp. abscessus]
MPFDQSNSFLRSDSGTPSRSAIASSGRSTATSWTKSPVPRSAAWRTMVRAASSSFSSSACTARGVNAFEITLRRRVCSGGS